MDKPSSESIRGVRVVNKSESILDFGLLTLREFEWGLRNFFNVAVNKAVNNSQLVSEKGKLMYARMFKYADFTLLVRRLTNTHCLIRPYSL